MGEVQSLRARNSFLCREVWVYEALGLLGSPGCLLAFGWLCRKKEWSHFVQEEERRETEN